MQRVKAILFDAGWMRYGWPERVGGLGGSPMLRTELGAALAARDLTDPGLFSLIEVLAPTLIDFAPPDARGRGRAAPALGRGDVVPGLLGTRAPAATSRRSSCRAVPDGDADDRVDVGDQRPEGVDEPGAVLRPLRAADAHRHRRSRATAASPRSSSTWTRPASRSRRSR